MGRHDSARGHAHSIIKRSDAKGLTVVNVSNQFKGNIKEIVRRSVPSEVEVQTPNGVVTPMTMTRSVDDLDLKAGKDVIALVKSTEVFRASLNGNQFVEK